VAAAGSHTLIRTAEPLVAADTDTSIDLYERTGGGTTLLSAGPEGGNGAYPVNFAAALEDDEIFFQTEERLTAFDTDDALDVYRRDGSQVALVSFGPDGGNGPHDAHLAAVNRAGGRIFISTREQLLASDTDQAVDIYQRSGGVVTLISTGPNGGNGPWHAELAGISENGRDVFFETNEQLVATDTDGVQDVYQRSDAATTSLVSTGPAGTDMELAASLETVTPDGEHVFFATSEPLVAADTDDNPDVYERSGGATTIHSIGPDGGNGNPAASLAGISDDGAHVFFETAERLNTTTDRDSRIDVYESAGGAVTLVTPGPNDATASVVYFVGASSDGARVLVRTDEDMAAPDTDGRQDIYLIEGGAISLASSAGGGGAPFDAQFAGMSNDATHIYFETQEPLVAGDTDAQIDVYERYGGTTALLSSGPTGGNGAYDALFRAASPDGKRVFFRTDESLISTDTDLTADTYSANVPGTVTVQLDAVPDDAQDFPFSAVGLEQGGFNFGPLGFGPTMFDLDDDADPTLIDVEVFTQVTPGTGYSVSQTPPPGWDLASAACDDGSPVANIGVAPGEDITCTFTEHKRGRIEVILDAVPDDPQDFSFTTAGGLPVASFTLDDDSDGTLPNTFTIDDVPAGTGYSVAETVPAGWSQGSATCDDGSPVSDIDLSPGETVTCTFVNIRGYPRPKAARPVRLALVPGYEQCTTPNRTHGPPLEHPACNPPVQTSSHLTVGTPDANSRGANMTGSLRLGVLPGVPSTPEDEADVPIDVSATDVRNASDLSDYTGELEAYIVLRITDRHNGPAQDEIGTVSDLPFTFPVQCTASTGSGNIGAACHLSTTADAVLPGAVVETKRTIWQVGRAELRDGGPDQLASTQDNTVFLRSGVFIP